jgi:hypothetical protein
MKIDFNDLGNIESFYNGFEEDYDSTLNERVEDINREINLKRIDNIVFDGIDHTDAPDYCDVFIQSADMNGWPMSEDELTDLNENFNEWVHEKLMDYLH